MAVCLSELCHNWTLTKLLATLLSYLDVGATLQVGSVLEVFNVFKLLLADQT